MAVTEYPSYVGGKARMLHLKKCSHFVSYAPPRRATEEELRTLPVCYHCGELTMRNLRTEAMLLRRSLDKADAAITAFDVRRRATGRIAA